MNAMKAKSNISYKVLNALFCEDARKDKDEKDILVGVLSGYIYVSHFPARIPLSVWLNVEIKGRGKKEVEVRILVDRKQVTRGSFKMEKKEKDSEATLSLSTPKAVVPIDKPGTLKFQIRLDSGRWKDIIRKPIMAIPGED
ncbi:MAG: hypothetical protein WDZ84_10960 [Rhodovibrionaceae bacterium]